MVPFDTQSAMVTSGIRVGTSAVTSRGFTESDCVTVFGWMVQVIINSENESLIADIGIEVNKFMQKFPLYQ